MNAMRYYMMKIISNSVLVEKNIIVLALAEIHVDEIKGQEDDLRRLASTC